MPSPADIDVELCAAPNGSYGLSERLVKPDKPAALAQGTDAVAPAGQDLVRIGLMADIPDQPVVRRVEHVVQRDGELDDAKAGAEMAAGHRDGVDRLGAQLVGKAAKIAFVEPAQVGRLGDIVEKTGILVHELAPQSDVYAACCRPSVDQIADSDDTR